MIFSHQMCKHVFEDIGGPDDEHDVLDELDHAGAKLGEVLALLQDALHVGLDLQNEKVIISVMKVITEAVDELQHFETLRC